MHQLAFVQQNSASLILVLIGVNTAMYLVIFSERERGNSFILLQIHSSLNYKSRQKVLKMGARSRVNETENAMDKMTLDHDQGKMSG